MRKQLPYYHGCFGCGKDNPCGVKLEFKYDGEKVTASYSPQKVHMGFKGVVHGGVVTALLDEAMWWAVAAIHKENTFTVKIEVEFKQPLEEGKTYTVEGKVAEERKGRIFLAEGYVLDSGGNICAQSKATFLKAPKKTMPMLIEGLSDPSLFTE
jgi:uncharacterized protein (TIGR00369 family)